MIGRKAEAVKVGRGRDVYKRQYQSIAGHSQMVDKVACKPDSDEDINRDIGGICGEVDKRAGAGTLLGGLLLDIRRAVLAHRRVVDKMCIRDSICTG